MKKSMSWTACLAAVGMGVLFFAGCDGGGSTPRGKSTITGSVKSFPSSGAAGIVQVVGASRGGIEVEVVGSNIKGTTADDGLFILSGVSGGHREVRFSRGIHHASIGVQVPAHGTVHLDGVNVDDADNMHIDDQHTDVIDDHDDNGTNEVEDAEDDSHDGGTNEVHHSGSGEHD